MKGEVGKGIGEPPEGTAGAPEGQTEDKPRKIYKHARPIY